MGKGGKGSHDRKVEAYFYGVYYGVCGGPVNRVNSIQISDKAFPNTIYRTNTQTQIVDAAFFGGETSEGGVSLTTEVYLGGSTQYISDGLASKFGLTSSTSPAYRGLCTVYLNGWWAYDNAYVRPVAINATCIPQTWYPSKSAIPSLDGDPHSKYIYITMDVSATVDIAVSQAQINSILDLVQQGVDSGYTYGVTIDSWPDFDGIGFNSGGGGNTIADLRTWVNGKVTGGTIDYRSIAGIFGAPLSFAVSLVTHWDRRIMIFVAGGTCVSGSDDIAVASSSMADILSPTGGSYNVTDGTNVECFVINIDSTNTTHSAKMDNTILDGVPVVTDGTVPYLVSSAVGLDPVTSAPDMNPAHIIYHTLTNLEWGMSAPTYALDETSFINCADTLFNESFGLSLLWDKQSSIETFINDILAHINGTLFLHPQTGLLTLKLIRNDYTSAALTILTEDDVIITSFARKGWGDTINEILVQWTNPDSEQEETIPAHDLGNIAIQGGIVSDTRDYYGIRNANLAKTVALRDLSASSWPTASVELQADRATWNYVPGDVFKLTSAEYGFTEMIVRVTTIDYGKPNDSAIKITCLEDIFGLTQTQYVDNPPTTQWVDPAEDPAAMAFQLAYTMSYYQLLKLVGAGNVSDTFYPTVGVAIFAAQTGSDTQTFELFGPETTSSGTDPYSDIGQRRIVIHATLVNSLAAGNSVTLNLLTDFAAMTFGVSPTVDWFMVIGDSPETAIEMCVIVADDDSNHLTIRRGVLDTIPRSWTVGTSVWFYNQPMSIADPTERSAGETISYKACAITSKGTYPVVAAVPFSLVATERPYLPLRPANVVINGIAYGQDVNAVGLATFGISWSNRNRVTEDNVILDWTDATVAGEVGQTTSILVYNSVGTLINTISGLTGTTYTFTPATDASGAIGQIYIELRSVRAGYMSLQGMRFQVFLEIATDDDWSAWFETRIT